MAATHAHGQTLERYAGLHTLQMVQTPRKARAMARWLALMLLLLPVALLLMPWQQNVVGTGRAIAFNPVERPQFIVSPIEGRIKQWFVVEGDRVKAGQRIVELVDNDPNLERRLLDTEMAIDDQLRAVQNRMLQVENAIEAAIRSRAAQLEVARAFLLAEQKAVRSAEADEINAKANLDAAEPIYQLNKKLFDDNQLVSRVDFLNAERAFETAKAQYGKAKALVERAKAAEKGALERIGQVEEDTNQRIAAEKAVLEAVKAEYNNIERQRQEILIRIARQRAQYVNAPTDGTVFRLLANADQGGALVRPGERLASIVPEIKNYKDGRAAAISLTGVLSTVPWLQSVGAYSLAELFHGVTDTWPRRSSDYPGIVVEINLDGNDQPLVKKGDPVRIQFEGWPAVQFVGWPSAAVGTFAGKVYLVDPTTNEKGQFRILVVPDKHTPRDIDWPSDQYLRQGVRATGWVLLDQVPLGWELWRRLNGFPQTVATEEPKAAPVIGPVKPKAK